MYENKLKLSNLVARGRFELPHEWFKAICLTAWLPGNMVELTGVEPVSKKSLLTTNLILTLQVLYISFDLHLFTKYQSQEQVLMLKLSTQEPIRINLFVRQSLLVNTIMLSLIAF